MSRSADGDCLRAWNAPGNAANRSAAAAKHAEWSVALSEWVVDHPKDAPSGDDLVGQGCSYLFYSATHWHSYSGGWEADGDLRWGVPPGGSGRRSPAQEIEAPDAILHDHGELARLPADDGSPIGAREWRAVIDDWYDNGKVDGRHRCAAVRAAIEHVPTQGQNVVTAHEDLVEYAEQVC